MIVDGIRSQLIATTAITAIIGTKDSRTDKKAGIFAVLMPEETPLPAIVISQISGEGIPTMDAGESGSNGLHFARIQFSCYGRKYADAKSLARAVRTALEGFAGALPDTTYVGNAILRGEMDGFEEAPFVFHCPVDFEFTYSEP